jgi:hypothetical protein
MPAGACDCVSNTPSAVRIPIDGSATKPTGAGLIRLAGFRLLSWPVPSLTHDKVDVAAFGRVRYA